MICPGIRPRRSAGEWMVPSRRSALLRDRSLAMDLHPPDYCAVHPLPSAPQFVGREPELDELWSLWRDGVRGVVALVGLGGAGKTAIAARFLEELCAAEQPLRPAGLFVWSFYQEPDAGYFLKEAYRYFSGPDSSSTPAKGAGLLHLLSGAMTGSGAALLVLDGLERVQRQESDATGPFGQIEDPLLKGLLSRIAEGIGQTVALVTSRFPLVDLRSLRDHGYRHIDVEGLSLSAALALLRHHGVQGDDAALTKLVESYGAHALTLDHLGGLIGQFLGGDAGRAPEAPKLTSPQHDRQALRLARLLNAYQDHLPPAELALLCRLCLLQRSVKVDQVLDLFLCSPVVALRTARELEVLIQHRPISDDFPEDLRDDVAESIRETITEALQQAPLAGPDPVFQESIRLAIESLLAQHETNVENDVEELIRLYQNANLDVSTDQRPLPPQDQERVRETIARLNELSVHPLLPFQEPPAALVAAFVHAGWGKPSAHTFADLTPPDVMRAFRRVRQILQRFSVKHLALRRVREICRLHQRKWQAGGPLAALDATALRQVLAALVGRHLALREADGSVSVHPAVRDFFGQLATAPERGFWHHLIGEQLISLVRRPGLRLPTDQASLDLVEEAISHAVRAGRTEEARKLYEQVLGGHRHLAWKLGEMARGLRIIRSFNPRPDRWAQGWYLRALGELEEAFEHNNLPFFRADIRLLQGRLTEVEREGDPGRTAIADFLMGRMTRLPPDPLGCVIPRVQVLRYLGRYPDAWLATEPEQIYEVIGWEDNRARCQLIRAEVACQMGDGSGARQSLELATPWVLHSGSVEHLCLYHLARARISSNAGEFPAAQPAVDEGLRLARQCGLRLEQVELLNLQADISLSCLQSVAAEQSARESLRIASSPDCQFRWGAAQAGHLLGHSLIVSERLAEARTVLEETRSLREVLGDPRAAQTEELLRRARA
jgi:hypothetical protein